MASQGFRFIGSLLLGVILIQLRSGAEAIDGVRTVNLALRSIIYDPVSTHLFGTSADGLLEIDSSSGAVLRTFQVSTNLSKLELGAERGLLMGIDGEGAVQRFNLETLVPEGKIVVRPNSSVLDISASKTDPYGMAASFGTNRNPLTGAAQATAYLIRNGTALPDTVGRQYLSLQLGSAYAASFGVVQRLLTGSFGLQETGVIAQRAWMGDIIVHNGVLYHAAGFALRIDNFQFAAMYGLIHPENLMALNSGAEELLYLSKSTNGIGAVLNRFSLLGEHRGQFTFPVMDLSNFMDHSIAYWGANRAAFNTTQQLYLLELDKVFRTFDLSIFDQTIVPSTPVFGQPVELITTFTNQGGTAFNVTAAHSFSAAVHIGGSLSTNVEVLPSGSTFRLRTTLVPGHAGAFTASASVQSTGETGTENNSRERTVTVAFDPSFIRLPFRFISIGADLESERLAAYENGRLWVIDLKEPSIRAIEFQQGDFTISGGPGAFYLGVTKVDSRSLAMTNELAGIGSIGAASSVAGLVATADGTGTFLVRDGSVLGGKMPGSGTLAFNEDATLLYRLSTDACVLDRFRVTATGLVHEQMRTNAACTDFVAANGLVYFDSGVIYDSFSGQRRAESFAIFPPAYVAARKSGEIELLSRTNSNWVVRRFRGADLTLLAERTLPAAPDTVLDFVSLGGDYAALRGVNELQVFSVQAGSDETIRITARRGLGSQTVLTHGTVAGMRYRWERTAALAPQIWAVVGSETLGTGAPAELVVDAFGTGRAFFRVARLP